MYSIPYGTKLCRKAALYASVLIHYNFFLKALKRKKKKKKHLQFPVAWRDDPASAHSVSVAPEQRMNIHLQIYLPQTAHPRPDWTPETYTCVPPIWTAQASVFTLKPNPLVTWLMNRHMITELLQIPCADALPWWLGAKQNQSFVVIRQSSVMSWCWQGESDNLVTSFLLRTSTIAVKVKAPNMSINSIQLNQFKFSLLVIQFSNQDPFEDVKFNEIPWK